MISRSAEYAIRALVCLSQNPSRPLTSQRLAAASSVSPAYLKKVLHQLGRARLVRGRRGAGGGFVLGVPAHKLTVQSVVRAVDGGRSSVIGTRGPQTRAFGACSCHWPLTDVIAQIQGLLAATTIADLTSGCVEGATRVVRAAQPGEVRSRHPNLLRGGLKHGH